MLSILHVQTLNKNTVVIAAISSRPFVKAAVNAGYDVIAIDAFIDADTQHLAKACFNVQVINGKIVSQALLDYLATVPQQHLIGFCYGAGFEMQPDLLDQVSQIMPVLGNSSKVIKQCKDPVIFFKRCDKFGVPYPKVTLDAPSNQEGWLKKTIGGHGGTHIQHLAHIDASDDYDEAPVYFQRFQDGQPVSCLFFASADVFFIIGFNEQWVDSGHEEGFRYSGAVSYPVLSDVARFRFSAYVKALAKSFGLVGINSCDAICHGDDVFILEINPRLSATIDLYNYNDLMKVHIDLRQAETLSVGLAYKDESQECFAHQVVYADGDLSLKETFVFPEWVTDIPKTRSFLMGEPICTVHASATTALQAKQRINERVSALKGHF